MFKRKDIAELIAKGDDNYINVLVLKTDKKPYLLELKDRMPCSLGNDPTIVAQLESFAPGNDYVGLEASKDKRYIENCYHLLLQGLVNHLESGTKNMYMDYTTKGIKELEKIIIKYEQKK